MDRDRGFSFKLLVPPRANSSQVSAVRPQENIENCGDFMNTPQQGTCSKYFDKGQTMALPITNMVAPTMPTKQAFTKMKVVSPMEKDETNCNHAQLFSKLFDEVEKIQCWKVQTDSETVQMERRLQENKRTIETQRKAIQELQFGNESLSMKLEEQISDNDNLRNKDNATRNLFNILKDTFERSAEKIQLFESEREETHHLLMENSESVQKLFEAFESLRLQAVADQQEMQKAKEDLQHFESFKEKCHQEYNTVEKEVVVLKMQLKEKENEIQKLLLDLNEIQKQCKQLQDAADELSELLRTSKTEQESILQELNNTKQNHKETRKSLEATTALLEKSKEEYVKMIESKNVCLEELSRVKIQQAEKLEQIQATTLELQNALALEIKRAKELEDELSANNKELQRNKKLLEEAIDQSTQKSWQMKNLKDDLDKKSQSMECMQVKIDVTELKLTELTAELLRMTNEVQLIKNEAEIAFAENSALKTACQAAEIAKEDFKKKSTMAETEVQELVGQLLTEKQKNDEHTFQMEQMRQQIAQHEEKYKELLSNFNKLQSEKTDIQQQFESGSLNVKTIEANIKESEEKALKLRSEIQKLENENQHLRDEVGSITATVQEKYLKIENLQKEMEENCEHLENVIREKEEQIKAVETKLFNVRKKFDMKIKVQAEYQKENKVLKKQISKETSKSSHLENVMNSLHGECENLKRLNEEDHQKLFKDLESKSKVVAELSNEVERLRLTKAEAIKNKEETELKCQHKIADMVALMEKHKNQYDRIVEEKDAQLNEDKKKEVEAVAHLKSVVRDLEKHKTDNDKLKQQLKREVAEKENLQKELTDLKKDMSSMKVTLLSDIKSKQSPAPNYIQARSSETPNLNSSKRHVFDLSKTRKTPSYSKDEGIAEIVKKAECDAKAVQTPSRTTQKSKDFLKEDPKTPKSCNNGASGAAKIKSYRIRTPPSDLKAHWKKTSIELDFKSDSSDQSDILSFASAPAPQTSAGHCQLNISQKNPVNQKSPGNSLKVAAMKRMRDAGWAAVTGCDKRKKKTNEKIFA